MKSILFNTEMVRAILDGRKSVTRRVVKPQPKYCVMTQAGALCSETPIEIIDGLVCAKNANVTTWARLPYRPGDILYVRETWRKWVGGYSYKADAPDWARQWRPSIHMPREAARIFLRVTDVRVERLLEITTAGALKEGANPDGAVMDFASIWDSTIKKSDLPRYGWASNPWVWVIAFELISKEAAL